MGALSRPPIVLAAASLALVAAMPAQAACESEAHREFDFWLGVWDVQRPDGAAVGENRIERAIGGCVVRERYSTPRGYHGESLNAYDGRRRLWHQTWIDSEGRLLVLEGGRSGESMVLEGRTREPAGERQHRITWTPLADGRVRQHWQVRDPGRDWTTLFDGRYVRRPQAAAPAAPTTAGAAGAPMHFPDVVAVDVKPAGDGRFDFDVTLSSPYDSRERYADGFRVTGPDGRVFGERTLWHDHAGEQPFTRDLHGVRIPPEVRRVTVQGRDKLGGWGGRSVQVDLPGR